MTSWFDTHCHLDSIESPPNEIVARARSAGVDRMVTVGTGMTSSKRCVEIASEAGIYASVGVHPHEAASFDDGALAELDRLTGVAEVVAIGETGLDYYRDLSPRSDQRRVFIAHIDLAKAVGKTLVIHVRDAHEDLFEILEGQGPPERLVFHCFSGGLPEVKRALDLGAFLSFAGNISFPKADLLREAAAGAPLDRLLVETDSPYLTPIPHRGKRNEPAFVSIVGAALAESLGRSVEEVAAATSKNALEVFGISS